MSKHARNTDPDTSHAAVPSDKRLGQLYQVVLWLLREYPDGLTAWEMTEHARVGRESLSPRTATLRERGLIFDTGIRRVSEGRTAKAIVWRLTEAGKKRAATLIQ